MKRPITDCALFVAAIFIVAGYYSVKGSDVDWIGWVVVAVLAVIIRFAIYFFQERRRSGADLT